MELDQHSNGQLKDNDRKRKRQNGDVDEIITNDSDNKTQSSQVTKRRKCPYLDTINHQVLDFDFEKVCSISLSDLNVYACLICGKYFQGRGNNTHAFTHSVQSSHHVFINLQTEKIYCLPENYEVIDTSLAAIQLALNPEFSTQEIKKIDSNRLLAQDAFGVSYLPGFVGLNNLKHTDYINVVVQALAHIPPLRNYFLNAKEKDKASVDNNITRSPLVLRFGELVRKMWSPHNFKNSISPHEFVQEISVSSKKRFQVGQQNESVELLSWLLNELHRGLVAGTKKKTRKSKSIIHKCFQGEVDVKTVDATIQNADVVTSKFLLLSLDLPSTPLFKDSQGGNIIPQIPLFTVLEKYNGSHVTHILQGSRHLQKTYTIRKLPPYLIFHIKRFTKNNFFIEKNSTIVNFPVKNFELRDCLNVVDGERDWQTLSKKDIGLKSISELKEYLKRHKIPYDDCIEKSHLVEKVKKHTTNMKTPSTKYNLIVNICHDSPVQTGRETAAIKSNPLVDGTYRIHVQNKATEQWYEIQDLHVQETMPQLIGVSESYLLIYEQKNE